jgi:GNAT superfamily N-acetyltransferase
MTIELRDLQRSDETAWQHLWRGYLDFYASPEFDARTPALWEQILDPAHSFQCRVAVMADEVVGIVQFFDHLDTWFDRPVCYLNDLFVDPSARGHGIGRLLVEDVNSIAAARGWQHVYWHTQTNNNDHARAVYDSFPGVDAAFMVYELPPANTD